MTGIIIWIILIALAALLLWAIINKKMTNSGGNVAATSVFSDMQNEDKRKAMETVIEEAAGKKRFGQESGEKQKPGNETEHAETKK
jgi:FtsZ-interacting cell division protein ZipA